MKRVISFCAVLVLGFASTHLLAQTTIDPSYVTPGMCGTNHTGVPIVLCAKGSYKLVASLSSTTTDIIDITGDNITLDLNGFTLAGNITCNANNGYGNTCSGTGSLYGIYISGRNVVVKNGTVSGINGTGIYFSNLPAGGELMLSDLLVVQNRGLGISALRPVTIRNVDASLNTSTGILAGTPAAKLNHVTANHNNGEGFNVTGGILEDVTASYNNSVGIDLSGGTLTRAQATVNNGAGMALEAVTLRDGYTNGNASDGVAAVASIVFQSTGFNNGGYGFSFDSLSCYSGIGATTNTSGRVSGGSVLSSSTGLCSF